MKKINVKVLALVCMSLALGSSSVLSDDWDDLANTLNLTKSNKGTNQANVKEFFSKLGKDISVEGDGFKYTKNTTIDGTTYNANTQIQNCDLQDLDLLYKQCSSNDGFLAFYQGWRSGLSLLLMSAVFGGLGFLGRGLVADSDNNNQDNS